MLILSSDLGRFWPCAVLQENVSRVQTNIGVCKPSFRKLHEMQNKGSKTVGKREMTSDF